MNPIIYNGAWKIYTIQPPKDNDFFLGLRKT